VTINDNPRVLLTLDVTPSDESPPFRTSIKHLVSRITVPRPGDRLAAVLDPAHPGTVVLVPGQGGGAAAAAPPALVGSAAGVPGYGTPDAGRADSAVSELERLARLRSSGALTEAEFARMKARILGE
jgi:hypothetical protein